MGKYRHVFLTEAPGPFLERELVLIHEIHNLGVEISISTWAGKIKGGGNSRVISADKSNLSTWAVFYPNRWFSRHKDRGRIGVLNNKIKKISRVFGWAQAVVKWG